MKSLMCALLVVVTLVTALVVTAPSAKADDCGYWATRYESVYVPPQYMGVDLYGRPIYSAGYYAYQAVPYYVYQPCPPRVRIEYRGYAPRHHHRHARFSLGFGLHW